MISALILAAGESKRLGQPKALLKVVAPIGNGERNFVEEISYNLWRANFSDIVLVLGANALEIWKQLKPVREKIMINSRWKDGQISSLQIALNKVWDKTEAILVCLVDTPLIKVETYQALFWAWKLHQGSIVIPRHKGKHGHPVIFDHRFFHELSLAPLDEGAHWVTRRHSESVLPVDVDDVGVVEDIDTMEDYKKMVGSHG